MELKDYEPTHRAHVMWCREGQHYVKPENLVGFGYPLSLDIVTEYPEYPICRLCWHMPGVTLANTPYLAPRHRLGPETRREGIPVPQMENLGSLWER